MVVDGGGTPLGCFPAKGDPAGDGSGAQLVQAVVEVVVEVGLGCGADSGRSRQSRVLVNAGQLWSTLVKHSQRVKSGQS
jgi:hypothetical protein